MMNIFTALSILLSFFEGDEVWISVSYDGTNYDVHDSRNESDMAYVRYKQVYTDEGWGRIESYLSSDTYSEYAIRSLGFAEGYLTHDSIYNFFMNMKDYYTSKLSAQSSLADVESWTKSNQEYVTNYTQTTDTNFQKHVSMMYALYQGMRDGYNAAIDSGKELSEDDFYLFECMNDLDDVIHSFDEPVSNWTLSDDDNLMKRSHSSAYVKLTPRKNELFFAHNTRSTYSAITRIQKTYHLVTPSNTSMDLFFTSYPGLVSSGDDFFITSHNLAISDSNLLCLNTSLYESMTPSGLPNWLRITAAATLATTAPEFVEYIQYNLTGTYPAQYLVVDYDLIESDSDLKDNGIPANCTMLVETYPLGSASEDVASIINDDNHFAMYTVPHIDSVYELMGYKARVQENDDSSFYWSKDDSSRYNQFGNQKILDLSTAKAAIRYNKYQNDNELRNPYLNDERDAGSAIAARYDLREEEDGAAPNSLGSIDAKV